MTTGIFNPFKKPEPPKKDFKSSIDLENPLDTEYPEAPIKSIIRMDGDSYVLQFNNIDLEDLPERLEKLMLDVSQQYQKELATQGVQYIPKSDISDIPSGYLKFDTPSGNVVVYSGSPKKESDCYRRLAYALYTLPIKEILKKHNAEVYKRG